MTIIEFMARVAATTVRSGVRPYTVRLSDADIVELQSEVAAKAGSMGHFGDCPAWHMIHVEPGKLAEQAVMRLDSVYILRGAHADPEWS